MRSRSLQIFLPALCWFLMAGVAVAQDDAIARARSAATRPEGIAILAAHLTTTPQDVDARLVYALMLSWESKYDEARTEFMHVLAQSPDYIDARVGLMNVEFWSGRTREAREQVNAILTKDAGNQQARLVQQRLDAKTTPWSAGLSMTIDSFNDGRESWEETAITVGRETPIGSISVRGNKAGRFGLADRQVEVEFYPKFRAGTYAFVGVGIGTDQRLYPKSRVSVDLYQSVGRGIELSAGYRQLNFSERTRIYIGTITKYVGNWMVTGKVFTVPGELSDSWSYHGVARRYFGSDGTSFIGAAYSHGFSREEVRGEGDLIDVNADSLRAQADLAMTERARLSFSIGSSRQERVSRAPLWQTTASGGLTLRF